MYFVDFLRKEGVEMKEYAFFETEGGRVRQMLYFVGSGFVLSIILICAIATPAIIACRQRRA